MIGGGISGLAAAFELRRRLGPAARITVLEKGPAVGGHLRVVDVAGLPVDAGAESLLARRPEAVDLAVAAGLGTDVVSPAPVSAGIWSRGSIHPMPPGTVMGVPADPESLRGLLTADEIDAARVDMSSRDTAGVDVSRRGTARGDVARRVPPRLGGTPTLRAGQGTVESVKGRAVDGSGAAGPAVDGPVGAGLAGAGVGSGNGGFGLPLGGDVTIGELVAAHYGRAVVDRLVEPLLGGVYAGHADRLSLDATVPVLAAAARRTSSLPEAVRATARPGAGGRVFAGIVGGVGRLPGAVAAASGAEIRTGVTVRRIERTPAGWRVVTGPTVDEEALDVDGVVVAVPASAASRLLRGVAPVAAADLGEIELASMAIVTLVVPRAGFPGGTAPASSGFLVPPVEGRTVKAVTYSSVKWPWLGELAGDVVALRASIGRAGDVRELQRDDADLVTAVREDLAAMAGVSGAPVGSRVTRWGGALPQYAVGHLERVERIRADVARVPGVAVCGAVYDGVGVAACVASATRAAADLVAGLTATPPTARVRIDP